jgi:choline dehydrogenase
VRTHALVTRVLLDGSNRAVGVEYLDGPHLYRADPAAPGDEPAIAPPRTVRATREVILAAGAFNTPQILMLSGIGPRDELGRHGIPVRVDLPGVGRNLQDRYEVGVVSAMEDDFRILRGATFRPPVPGEAPDPQFREWQRGEGVYTTNGAIIAVIERSSPAQPDPDLYLFGLAGHFVGYYTGYSKDIERGSNRFTWAVLKGSTKNTAGRVTLRSADPRDTPSINFSYFEEGNDAGAEDLEAVVAGVQRVREIMARPPIRDLVAEELVPGPAVRTPDDIRRYVRDNAWGHHASCSCAIGRDGDPTAVLDSRFGVRGTKGLRVVDASAFPRIPGLFIVSAVYMLAEKASDVILEDARTSPPLPA